MSLPIFSTPISWAETALSDLESLLNDHLHLERKAAQNAIELLPRWPYDAPPPRWTEVLTSVALDEVSHYRQVAKIMSARQMLIKRNHRSSYAQALRKLVRLGQANQELLDRLLVSALIEARSHERFELLSQACKDKELAKFYRALAASERGHYTVFLLLAEDVVKRCEVEKRWEKMLSAEATIIQSQPQTPAIHSW
jgi:tRNA-(ms[2]io[6]A)-hydroxylase